MPRRWATARAAALKAALLVAIPCDGQARDIGAWKTIERRDGGRGLRVAGDSGAAVELGCERPGPGSLQLAVEFGRPIGDDAASDAYHVHAARYQLDGGQWRSLPTIFYRGSSAAIVADPERSEVIKLLAAARPNTMAVSVRTFDGEEAIATIDVTGFQTAAIAASRACGDPTTG